MSPTANLEIIDAHENNLKNISLKVPKNKLVVVTGVSGSGKSSLVFDTIFKEGQRRYVASLSSYARQFIQNIDQPKVGSIDGLSPTICIDQKSVSRNPRSTVGTVSEIYDFLRLLYARLGVPHCPRGHGPIETQTAQQILKKLNLDFAGKMILIMAPLVIDRKGEYQKEFKEYYQQGFSRILVNQNIYKLGENIELNRYEKHTLELILDRVWVKPENETRINEAIYKAIDLTKGKVSFLEIDPESKVIHGDDSLKPKFRQDSKNYFLSNIYNACKVCGLSIKELEPNLFSFNSPADACKACQGLGYRSEFEPRLFVKDPEKSVFDNCLHVLNKDGNVLFFKKGKKEITKLYQKYGVSLDQAWKDVPLELQKQILDGDSTEFSIRPLLEFFYNKYRASIMERYMEKKHCTECAGTGLNEMARSVTFQKKSIDELSHMTIAELNTFITKVAVKNYSPSELTIWKPIAKEIKDRLSFLIKVGVEYLNIDRKANSLSGGESQRIRLAAQIGKGLEGCLYIFDEPSIGLHQVDNNKLINTLGFLRDSGNSLVVIEHDEETMLAADHLLEIGPLAGDHGGEVVFSDNPHKVASQALKQIKKSFSSMDYLIGKENIPFKKDSFQVSQKLELKGINHFNLKDLDVIIPLQCLTAITGVSGSGKSSLFEVLEKTWKELGNKLKPTLVQEVDNFSEIEKLVIINQKPIGRTIRSNPATYTGIWTTIRDIFTNLEESRIRNYKKGRFSFNVKGGRCEGCGGSGMNRIEMHLFSPIEVVCESCQGKRFNSATLEITYRHKNIFEILDLTIEKARDFFVHLPKLSDALTLMCDIGLGYLKLGQPSPTLSGGEAQRIKLVTELIKSNQSNGLLLLDEPTTGLHFKDIAALLKILKKLIEKGNSVLVVEHNLDIIKSSDYILELGPKGGLEGGKIINSGNIKEVMKKKTPTGIALKDTWQRQKKKESNYFLKTSNLKELFQTKHLSSEKKAKEPSSSNGKINVKKLGSSKDFLIIKGLKKNNLKNIDLQIPKNEITVFTGVSGSGKSSIAIDSIFAEGQRRYLESLSTYARRFLGRIPAIEAEVVENLSPTICIDQKGKTNNPRSTLATQTEIYDHLRVLFTNIATPHCLECNAELKRYSAQSLVQLLEKVTSLQGETLTISAPLYNKAKKNFYFIKESKNIKKYFEVYKEKGYYRFLIDDELVNINQESEVNKLKTSQIKSMELIIDRIKLSPENLVRLMESLEIAYELGSGVAHVNLAPDMKAKITDSEISSTSKTNPRKLSFSKFYACFEHGFFLTEEITPRHFSFNHHFSSCEECSGLGEQHGVDEGLLIEHPNLPFLNGALKPKTQEVFLKIPSLKNLLDEANEKKIDLFNTPFHYLDERTKRYILYGDFKSKWIGVSKWIKGLLIDPNYRKYYTYFFLLMKETICDECKGARLKEYILKYKIAKQNIFELTTLKVHELINFLESYERELSPNQKKIAHNSLKEILFRLNKLNELGLHYLSLDRKIATLSGGEIQRIRLASQIGNQLKNVTYVLDEPTVGLHEKDSKKLIGVINDLKKNQNTVLIVEHDAALIKAADYIVDVGLESGRAGGKITYQGKNTKSKLKATSIYPYVHQKQKITYRPVEPVNFSSIPYLSTKPIYFHNLKGVEVKLPLGKLTGICGVSGSGKSSLVSWIRQNLNKLLQIGTNDQMMYAGKKKAEQKIKQICFIDQDAISQNKRSIVSTYMGLYEHVRDVFALTHQAKANGFSKSHFSFNSPKGSCLKCNGLGQEEVEMHFISDLEVVCDECQGKRFKKEILAIYYQGKNIDEVLKMTFSEALSFFNQFKQLREKIIRLVDAGLGYLSLGTKTSELSGGELQRLKIAHQLAFAEPSSTFYILDEPTTGLHFKDIETLFLILNKILEKGGTLLVIEHNVDFLRSVDHLIELGLEGGEEGGNLINMGSVAELKNQVKDQNQGYIASFL